MQKTECMWLQSKYLFSRMLKFNEESQTSGVIKKNDFEFKNGSMCWGPSVP